MLRFTIRELLLVTVIVGMGICWWADHRKTVRVRELAVHMGLLWNLLRDEGYEVTYGSGEVELHHKKSGRIRKANRWLSRKASAAEN
jgi:hypothetical protein